MKTISAGASCMRYQRHDGSAKVLRATFSSRQRFGGFPVRAVRSKTPAIATKDVAPPFVEHPSPQPRVHQIGHETRHLDNALLQDGELMLDPLRVLLSRIINAKPDAYGLDVAPPGRPDALSRYPLASTDDAETEESETCVVAHPGSVCCSTTTVQRDLASKSVVVQLTTTVRLSNAKCTSVTISDLEQLGLVAGAQQLQSQAASLGSHSGSRTVQARHDNVLKVLARGRIVNAEKFTNQFGHVTFRCVLEEPQTRQQMHAIVKPSTEGHCHGWHRAEIEAVTYRLNRLLGMDYVPPCVYRKEVDVDWQHFTGGTFMYWAEGGRELSTQPMDQWGLPSEVLLSDTRILDVLIQNSDRHHGHFLIAEHWAHGTNSNTQAMTTWKGTPLPVLIDHAAGFRPEAFVDMRHQNAFNTGETVQVSAKTFLRLRCLQRSTVADALQDLLSPSEIDQVIRRRDDILSYLDYLVAERGYENVVIETSD